VTARITEATPEHAAAILRIEEASGGGSLVALTRGLALEEALARGHDVYVALDGGAVLGWIWFSTDMGRGAEAVGQVFRVGVDAAHRRAGIGTMLMAHACGVLAGRGVRTVRLSLDAADDNARAFFAAQGFTVETLSMERRL
jgi:ribosomal protein S18 acetylase RimI-like enzyme